MNIIEIILEIVKITIPPTAVIIAMHLLTKRYFDKDLQTKSLDLKMQKNGKTLPVRLQAYERMTLFLERISPNSLIMRIHKPGMSAKLLHADLLKAIREEYEHNMSQQIYISQNAWSLIKKAKEETTNLINLASGKVENGANGVELSQQIFQLMMQIEKSPSDIALEYLRREVDELFK